MLPKLFSNHELLEERAMSAWMVTFSASVLCCYTLLGGVTAQAAEDPIMAAAMATSVEQIPTISASPPVATSAVAQFVQGDFDTRSQLLQTWPDSPESLQQMVAAIEADQLYTDADGKVYLLKNETDLVDYTSGAAMGTWPESLDQVRLNNALRSVLDTVKAKTQLQHPDVSVRLAAVQTLMADPVSVDPALINAQLATEKDPQIVALLTRMSALQDLESGDAARELAGATALAASNDPEVLALINEKLSQDGMSAELNAALTTAQHDIQQRLKLSEWSGHVFSGISMASILLLAALGLAITYGLLGVINMAHGELIMIGAYTTYVLQNIFNQYFAQFSDWYLLAAIPCAFAVSALVGMIIERIVIRPLYGRQLETLLATFGVSLILMQLIRMIFGAQNVEVANVSWMSGGWVISPSLTIPYSRIAIIVFTIAVLILVKWLISGTRFGLFIRAVTQNRQMARAIGVRSARTDMLAFGLGSGLAGLAGCALSQIGNVGPDLGQTYIIDTFLVVVVGGVGQLIGAVLAALGLGIGGKFLEVGMGPVLAKICLLVLIILFIQKRPQGLFAVKGRFVE
jgi:urea transport system permease protein